MNGHDLLSTAGISLVVSSLVIIVNNYFLYKHLCPQQNKDKEEQSKEQSNLNKMA